MNTQYGKLFCCQQRGNSLCKNAVFIGEISKRDELSILPILFNVLHLILFGIHLVYIVLYPITIRPDEHKNKYKGRTWNTIIEASTKALLQFALSANCQYKVGVRNRKCTAMQSGKVVFTIVRFNCQAISTKTMSYHYSIN